MKNLLVSVLMTVYNREKYIATAIESVLAQSMGDFELIIVDDGSTDHSLDIAERYNKDSRVRIYPNERNIGQFPTRNRAASFAKGKYLKYVDSDDAIYPHCLEVMTHMMERYPDAGMLLCTWSGNDSFYPFELSPRAAYRRCFFHNERMSISPSNAMFRRADFESVGGFHNDKWPLSGDLDVVLKLARKFPVLFAPIGMSFYRMHAGQVITSQTNIVHNFTSEGLAILLEALRHSECPLPENEKNWAVGKILRGIILFTASLALKRRHPRAAYHFLKSRSVSYNELVNILNIKKPTVNRFEIGHEPNWSDFPRVSIDRLNNRATGTAFNVRNSLIIAGRGGETSWEKTIRSALAQSEDRLEIIVVSSRECSNPPLELVNKYPFLRLVSLHEDDIWKARNCAAGESSGDYIKFTEPGTFLFPYLLEFDSYPMQTSKDIHFSTKGELYYAPSNLKLDPKTAIACDLHEGFQVFRVHLTCVTLRRTEFLDLGGFNPEWGIWSAYELFLRTGLMGVTINTMFGLTFEDRRDWPDLIGNAPSELLTHIEGLLKNKYGDLPDEASWLSFLSRNASLLRQQSIDNHKWDWSQYPWSVRSHEDMKHV